MVYVVTKLQLGNRVAKLELGSYSLTKQKNNMIKIYTDGSCNTKYKIGAWAAILLFDDNQIKLHGQEINTTNNRMELLAIIESIKYVINNFAKLPEIQIYTDSQYAERLPQRKNKLLNNNFLTKKNTLIQNVDLVKIMLQYIDTLDIKFIKVKAHQKTTDKINYNRIVDKLSRQIVRRTVKKNEN